MKDNDTETGFRMIYDMTMKACGNLPLASINPQYIFSTDDTVEYTFEGNRFVSMNSMRGNVSRSVYEIVDTKEMSGLRVKLTFTFVAVGTCAPCLYLLLDWQKERYLPTLPLS